ncbi:MAG: beta-ketoacyl synthase N-terminal-like domain-containing protein, partial [Acidobacteriota bacterium]
ATLLASPGFDASVWELWPNLTAGAALHIPDGGTVASPRRLLAWLAEQGITLSFLPTPLAEAVLAEPLPAALALRALLTGGDKLHHSPGGALPFELVNHYGPTENTVVTSWTPVAPGASAPPIGRPLTNCRIFLLAAGLRTVPLGVPGELHIGSLGLARGYRGLPGLTAERFIPDPLSGTVGERLYRTGDLARYRADSQLEFLARLDHQVKIRGFRIELGEIEAVLNACPGVHETVVLKRQSAGRNEEALVAYVVLGEDLSPPASREPRAELRHFLSSRLPAYMVPAAFVFLETLPFLPNGKVDRAALARVAPALQGPEGPSHVAPRDQVERAIAAIWQELLEIDQPGTRDNFFDLGGHSLLLARLQSKLGDQFGREIPMVELFRRPTLAAQADYLDPQRSARARDQRGSCRAEARLESARGSGSEIAVVAMTGRFPGAGNVEELWRNLCDGIESVTFYSDEELLAAGVDPAVLEDPRYVKAGAPLAGAKWFDAQLFGISPREAELMDPQQRIFLECAWEALELAGYDPESWDGAVGVYAGIGMSRYLVNLYSNPEVVGSTDGVQLMAGNDKDFLPTRVSYKLNLKGPSINVQTACSTSLVAVHLACQGLLNG